MWEVALFLGPILEAKLSQNASEKLMQKLIKFSYAFWVKFGQIFGLFWRLLVDKIAMQGEKVKKQKWAWRRGESSIFKVWGHAFGGQKWMWIQHREWKKNWTYFNQILTTFWKPFRSPKPSKMEAEKWSQKGNRFWGESGSAWRNARTPWKFYFGQTSG